MKLSADPNSIRFRLTIGMVLAAAVGIGGLTGWLNWRMQQILIKGHKENALMVAERLGQDTDLYRDSMLVKTALAKAIEYREQTDMAIWVVGPEGKMLGYSNTLKMGSWQADGFADELVKAVPARLGLDVFRLRDRHLVTCVSPLTVNGQFLGELYVVDDITKDQQSLARVTKTLAISSVLAIGLAALLTSLYIDRALRPICKMNRLAAEVTANNLGDTRLEFEQAPTEVQELAQACNLMLSRLSDAWDQQRRFVDDISHELRTPLTLVQGYLQSTLRRGKNLSDPQREGLEIAADETDRTIRLLEDLLDLARAEGGNMRMQVQREPLHEVVAEVLEMGQYSSDRLQADITPVEGLADRTRLKQVLVNLIDNAMRYSDASQPVEVSLQALGDRAYIEVRDAGRGIPLCDLTKIFEPFYRVDADRSRKTGGTGLGLSIVKTLVEGMNGTLKVQSKLGKGSVFTVCLPI